jgi:hypothetical protein
MAERNTNSRVLPWDVRTPVSTTPTPTRPTGRNPTARRGERESELEMEW